MDTTKTQYELAANPLTDVVEAVPPHRWSAPSPCEGWAAHNVLGHLIDTQRDLLATHGVVLGEVPDVTADPAASWREHTREVTEALTDDAVPAIAYDGFFGPTTLGATLIQFYGWDMLVHRWDIAAATGGDGTLSDDELDRVEAGAVGFGEALYADGICKPPLSPPADADRQTRALALLGRAALTR